MMFNIISHKKNTNFETTYSKTIISMAKIKIYMYIIYIILYMCVCKYMTTSSENTKKLSHSYIIDKDIKLYSHCGTQLGSFLNN